MATAIEFFAGCGGAALGLREAGLQSRYAVELDADCVAALAANDLPGVQSDVREVRFDRAPFALDVAPGVAWFSPPCQGFSQAGEGLGARDPRNGFPWTLDLLDRLDAADRRPGLVIVENVPGLVQHQSRSGCRRGAAPQPLSCARCYFDGTRPHFGLDGVLRASVLGELRSRFRHVEWTLIQCADLGVPQRRERVVVAAWDEGVYAWPAATHSQEALAHAKWVTGDYWRALDVAPVGSPSVLERHLLDRMRAADRTPTLAPWRTIREALLLRDVATPGDRGSDRPQSRRDLFPDEAAPTLDAGGTDTSYRSPALRTVGARPAWTVDETPPHLTNWEHRASDLDEPTRTIGTMRNAALVIRGGGSNPHHAGGVRGDRALTDEPCTTIPANTFSPSSNALPRVEGDGGVRRLLTIEECALLQDFPPGFSATLVGTKRSRYRAIGNAVPRTLARALARGRIPR